VVLVGRIRTESHSAGRRFESRRGHQSCQGRRVAIDRRIAGG